MISVSLRRAALSALFSLCALASVDAAPILLAEYDFASDGTPSSTAAGVNATSFVGGSATLISGGLFDFGATTSTTASPNNSGSFTITVTDPLNSIDLDSLTFDARRFSGNATGALELRITTATAMVYSTPVATNAFASFSISLIGLNIVGDTFTLSLVDTVNNQDARILMDNLRLFGTLNTDNQVTPVPEPASLALMGLGGIGMIGGAIRKRRKTTIAA